MLHWEIMGLRAAIALSVLLSAGALVLVGQEVLTPADALEAAPVVVEIPAHDGVMAIAARLHRAGGIRSRVGFVLLAGVRGTARHLRAGEYELERGATTFGVLTQLESGRVKQHVVLHPEGATLTELARALESERLAPGAAVTRLAADQTFLATLAIEAPSLEGYVFPDTYQFVRGMTAEEILTRMVQRLRAKLGSDIMARAATRGLSVHQLLTLASIIEREAVERSEMRTISAVFWNRLKLNMPLQADPTVQYATGTERRAQRGGRPVPARPRSVNRAIKRATWPAPPRLPRPSASPARGRSCRSSIARSAVRYARRSDAGSICASRGSSTFPPAARISSRRTTTTIWTASSSASPRRSRSRSSSCPASGARRRSIPCSTVTSARFPSTWSGSTWARSAARCKSCRRAGWSASSPKALSASAAASSPASPAWRCWHSARACRWCPPASAARTRPWRDAEATSLAASRSASNSDPRAASWGTAPADGAAP